MITTQCGIGGAILAYPMHGQRKLSGEGYRTRDGHVIEWLGRLQSGGVSVISRPEPVLLGRDRARHDGVAAGTTPVRTSSWRLPDPRDRRRWWVDSAHAYPALRTDAPAVVWNPFTALARPSADPFRGTRRVVLDLLDDWSVHYAFASIAADVERAYGAAFARATHVTANAEGTLALAHRFGRSDAVLLPNGCDPERFALDPVPHDGVRIGYVGKIGRRLDLGGILATIDALPAADFVFAGPVLDPEYRAPLAARPNVTLLGDVHYDRVPQLLRTFDVGWVPHRVGDHEVGGDVMKTYEYRAAGLATLSTPVAGAGTRGIAGVTAAPITEHARVLRCWTRHGTAGPRRDPAVIPPEATWRHKAAFIGRLLGLEVPA